MFGGGAWFSVGRAFSFARAFGASSTCLLALLVTACGSGSGAAKTSDGGSSGDGSGGGGSGDGGTGGGPAGAWFDVLEPLPDVFDVPDEEQSTVERSTAIVAATPDGSVVVGQSTELVMGSSTRVASIAFRWTREGGVEALGFPEEPPIVTPAALSRDGAVVVGKYGPGTTGPLFRWTPEDGMVLLETGDASGYVLLGALSDDGTSFGGTLRTGAETEAVRWTTEDGYSALGFLPGEVSSSALSIAADGETLAGASGSRVFRWTSRGGMEDLDLSMCRLSPGGISADGSVLVGTCAAPDGGTEAFVWTEGNGKTSLGTLPASVTVSAVEASPEGGVFVGQSVVGRDDYQAVRGSEEGRFVRLGAFDGLSTCVLVENNFVAFPDARPSSSRDGSVVAGTCLTTSGTAEDRGFRWSEADGLVALEPLEGDVATWVTSVSPDGIVAGLSVADSGEKQAVIWDASGAPRSVAAELEAAGVELDGFRLDEDLVVFEGGRLVRGAGHDGSGAALAFVARLR